MDSPLSFPFPMTNIPPAHPLFSILSDHQDLHIGHQTRVMSLSDELHLGSVRDTRNQSSLDADHIIPPRADTPQFLDNTICPSDERANDRLLIICFVLEEHETCGRLISTPCLVQIDGCIVIKIYYIELKHFSHAESSRIYSCVVRYHAYQLDDLIDSISLSH